MGDKLKTLHFWNVSIPYSLVNSLVGYRIQVANHFFFWVLKALLCNANCFSLVPFWSLFLVIWGFGVTGFDVRLPSLCQAPSIWQLTSRSSRKCSSVASLMFPPLHFLSWLLDFGSPGRSHIFSHFPSLFLCLNFYSFPMNWTFSSVHGIFISVVTFLTFRVLPLFFSSHKLPSLFYSCNIFSYYGYYNGTWGGGGLLFCLLLWITSAWTYLPFSVFSLLRLSSPDLSPLSLFLWDCFSLYLPEICPLTSDGH